MNDDEWHELVDNNIIKTEKIINLFLFFQKLNESKMLINDLKVKIEVLQKTLEQKRKTSKFLPESLVGVIQNGSSNNNSQTSNSLANNNSNNSSSATSYFSEQRKPSLDLSSEIKNYLNDSGTNTTVSSPITATNTSNNGERNTTDSAQTEATLIPNIVTMNERDATKTTTTDVAAVKQKPIEIKVIHNKLSSSNDINGDFIVTQMTPKSGEGNLSSLK
jgi:hypothetical protein